MHVLAVEGRVVGFRGGEGVCVRGGLEGSRGNYCLGVGLSSRFGIEDGVAKFGCWWR